MKQENDDLYNFVQVQLNGMCNEIADVEIMIEQLKGMFLSCDDNVERFKKFKLERLAKRIEEDR